MKREWFKSNHFQIIFGPANKLQFSALEYNNPMDGRGKTREAN
jgi:hypothetical protein